MWYITILILLLILCYHYDYKKNTKNRSFWYICILILFIVTAGLRYRLGTDTITYEREYITLPDLYGLFTFDYSKTRYGIGYMFINAIARTISDKFVVMQFLQSSFVNIIIFYFFYKYTKHIFFALILYSIILYFYFNFEILRESCAVCCLLIGWKYFLSNNWLKYYLCAIIGFMFHPSALIISLLPLFYLPVIRNMFKFGWLFIFGIVFIFLISKILAIKFFDLLALIDIANGTNSAETYSNGELGKSISMSFSLAIFYFIKNLLYPLLAIIIFSHKMIFIKEGKNVNDEKQVFMLCWFVYLSIATIFLHILLRFCNYFLPFVIVYISNIIFSKIKFTKTKKFVKLSFGLWIVLFIPYISMNLYEYFNIDPETNIIRIRRYYPYSSVLFPETNTERENIFTYYDK